MGEEEFSRVRSSTPCLEGSELLFPVTASTTMFSHSLQTYTYILLTPSIPSSIHSHCYSSGIVVLAEEECEADIAEFQLDTTLLASYRVERSAHIYSYIHRYVVPQLVPHTTEVRISMSRTLYQTHS